MMRTQFKLLKLFVFVGSLAAMAVAATEASANTLAHGFWKSEDYSGAFTRVSYMSIDADKIETIVMIGQELSETHTQAIRFPDPYTIELQNQKSLAWDESYELDVITWKMRWCRPGSTQNCIEFEKLQSPYFFLPTSHFVPKGTMKLIVTANDTQRWDTIWEVESELDNAELFADRTSDTKFGHDSEFEFVSPDKAFKIKIKLTTFYTNEQSSMGASIFDYGYFGQAEWIDLASGKSVFTQDFESSWGLSFSVQDPNGAFEIYFQSEE